MRRTLLWASGAITILVAATGGTMLLHREPTASPDELGAIAACESSLLKRLKAPATYKRISAKWHEMPALTKQEWLRYQETRSCGDQSPEVCRIMRQSADEYTTKNPEGRKLAGLPAKMPNTERKRHDELDRFAYARYLAMPALAKRTAFADIVYDANNAFNTPLRGEEVCRFGPILNGATFSEESLYSP